MESLALDNEIFNCWTHNLSKLLEFLFMYRSIQQGARQQSRMQDLQSHIERLSREKMALESTVVELSSYKNEVTSLRSDLSKLQVSHDQHLPHSNNSHFVTTLLHRSTMTVV